MAHMDQLAAILGWCQHLKKLRIDAAHGPHVNLLIVVVLLAPSLKYCALIAMGRSNMGFRCMAGVATLADKVSEKEVVHSGYSKAPTGM